MQFNGVRSHTVLKIVFLLILCFALTVFLGCAEKVTFFHGGMPNFEPGPEGGVDLVDIKRGIDFSKYKFLIVEPRRMHFDSTDQYTSIPSDILRELRADFNRAIVDALQLQFLTSGMIIFMDLLQPFRRDLCINLCCRYIFVSKHFL